MLRTSALRCTVDSKTRLHHKHRPSRSQLSGSLRDLQPQTGLKKSTHRADMAERNSSGLMMMMMMVEPSLPAEVREKLAELELELSEGKVAASLPLLSPHTDTLTLHSSPAAWFVPDGEGRPALLQISSMCPYPSSFSHDPIL